MKLLQQFGIQAGNKIIIFLFRSPEAKLVHGDGKVPGLVVAVVEVSVVHGDQVHVAEDEAVILGVLQSLCVTDVQQFGSVERVFTQLREMNKEDGSLASLHL